MQRELLILLRGVQTVVAVEHPLRVSLSHSIRVLLAPINCPLLTSLLVEGVTREAPILLLACGEPLSLHSLQHSVHHQVLGEVDEVQVLEVHRSLFLQVGEVFWVQQ